MRILSVALLNIKSYGQGPEVQFHPGMNFISGQNGAGKTTLLESIGYALFDHNNYSKASSMLRNGAKKGRIEVTFTLDDAVAFTVSRHVLKRGTGSWSIREQNSDLEIVAGEADVKRWIRTNLGIDEETDMAQLYSQIIGVPQGEITTHFKGTEKERQKHFDPLMGTESYIEAFKNSSSVETAMSEERATLGSSMATLKERCKDFDEEKDRLSLLGNEILELSERKKASTDRKNTVDEELTQLNELKKELAASEKMIASLDARMKAEEERQQALGPEIANSELAIKVLHANEGGHAAYLRAIDRIGELQPMLDAMKQKEKIAGGIRDSVAKRVGECAEKRRALEAESIELAEEIVQISEALGQSDKALMEKASENKSLKEKEAGQSELEAIIDSLGELRDEYQQDERMTTNKRKDLRSREGKRKKLEEKVENAPAMEVVQARIGEIEEKLSKMNEEKGALESKKSEYEELLGMDGKCPYTDQPCSDINPRALKRKIAEAQTRLRAIEKSIQQLTGQKKEAEKARKEAEKAEGIRENIEELGEDIEGLMKEIAGLECRNDDEIISKKMDDWMIHSVSVGLAVGIPPRGDESSKIYLGRLLPVLEEACRQSADSLDSRRRYLDEARTELNTDKKHQAEELKKRKDRSNKNAEGSKKLAEEVAKIEEDRSTLSALESELEKLASVEEDLVKTRDLQTEHSEAYREYEVHKLTAAKIDELRAELSKVTRQIVQRRDEIAGHKARQEEIRHLYSEEIFDQMSEEKMALVDQLAELRKALDDKHTEEEVLKNKIEGMERDLASLMTMNGRFTLLESGIQASRAIRAVLNDAGPIIAGRYRQVISENANQIFRDIHAEKAELAWQENYLVTLRDQKGDREFNQLSGGEQMTAALAIQLALAKEFSNLGVAMFDEPTTNMDKDRRGELAKIIAQIKESYGFDQMFVISHDEAFETMTEQIIRLEKEDGETKVMPDI